MVLETGDRDGVEATIESQLFELKRHIAAACDVLVKEYIDDGISGTLLDRPALNQMRADLKTDLFDSVFEPARPPAGVLDVRFHETGRLCGILHDGDVL